MPADFRLIMKTEVWPPSPLRPMRESGGSGLYLLQVSRLKPGVSMEQARQEIENMARRHINSPNAELSAYLTPLQTLLMAGLRSEVVHIQLAAGRDSSC